MNQRVAGIVDLVRQRVRPAPAELAHLLGELVMQIAPFNESEIRHEMRAAALDQAAMRQTLGERIGEELPERDQAQEIGPLVAKAQMRLIRRLLLFERPLARIGHRERAGDHQYLRETTQFPAGDDDPADARVDWKLRELPPERSEPAPRVDRGDLLQQLVAVGDRACAG